MSRTIRDLLRSDLLLDLEKWADLDADSPSEESAYYWSFFQDDQDHERDEITAVAHSLDGDREIGRFTIRVRAFSGDREHNARQNSGR